jgi:hypothetical protein
VELAVKVQSFVVDPEVAAIVTVAPTTRPPTETDGVVSLVMLSEFRVSDAGDVSDAGSRSAVSG